MPSAWIERRETGGGEARYLVKYRLGGRESAHRYAGSFPTRREALARRRWVAGELAAMRVPRLGGAGEMASETRRVFAEFGRRRSPDAHDAKDRVRVQVKTLFFGPFQHQITLGNERNQYIDRPKRPAHGGGTYPLTPRAERLALGRAPRRGVPA